MRILDDLEQGGFVTPRVDPNDRRACIVEATTSARELQRIAAELIGQIEAELLQSPSTPDRSTLRKVVRELALGPFAATFDPTSPTL